MKRLSIGVLVFIALLWMLTGCVVTVNNNWGSGITTSRTIDDQMIGQEYDAEVKR